MSRVWVRLVCEKKEAIELEFELPAVPRVGDFLLVNANVWEITHVAWNVDATQAQRTYDAIVDVTARASA